MTMRCPLGKTAATVFGGSCHQEKTPDKYITKSCKRPTTYISTAKQAFGHNETVNNSEEL